MSAWRTVADTYKKAENREIFSKALELLSAKPEELRDWAIESQDRQWDFQNFWKLHFFKIMKDDIFRLVIILSQTHFLKNFLAN